MKETDIRDYYDARWYENKHTLTRQEVEKLIKEKFERARLYHEATRKRETALQRYR